MLELLRNVTKWPCAIFAGQNRGVAQAFGFHKLCVVISLVFLLCSQNDSINSAVGDSDIGSGVSVTVLWFAVSLWFVANFVFRRNMQACAPGVWPSLTYLFQFYQFLHGIFTLDLLTWVFGSSGSFYVLFTQYLGSVYVIL